MRIAADRKSPLRLLAVVALGLALVPWPSGRAAAGPFDALLGSWQGAGQIKLKDGRTERVKCNAYYTGGGSQLGLAIRCQSESSNVEIRGKLSQSGSRVSGTWEERTFNAAGTASGQASSDRISLQISGGVSGTMQVSYSKSRQSVSISTQNIALRSVTINLTRS
jgi:predicted secreted hydrolase